LHVGVVGHDVDGDSGVLVRGHKVVPGQWRVVEDAGGGGRGGVDGVVTGGGAGQAEAGGRHQLARATGRAVEGRRAPDVGVVVAGGQGAGGGGNGVVADRAGGSGSRGQARGAADAAGGQRVAVDDAAVAGTEGGVRLAVSPADVARGDHQGRFGDAVAGRAA